MTIKRSICLFIVLVLLLPVLLMSVLAAENNETDATRAVGPVTTTVTFNLYVYRNSAMSATLANRLDNLVSVSANAIYGKFNVDFNHLWTASTASINQRSGCTRSTASICSETCGAVNSCYSLHHKAGDYFLYRLANSSTKVLRFVDYSICYYDGSTHKEVAGMASPNDMNALVSMQPTKQQKTTSHELSHLIGALDGRCSSTNCVMAPDSSATTTWCSQCTQDINSFMRAYVG